MLFRFSLYGFLKNQRYYEPFLYLAFLARGMSFWQIGLLIGFRELCVNLMEIPTGAMADVLGRRRSMVLSFVAYAVAFATFGLAPWVWLLFPAMFLFSIGEAFRTGTHKAMIFDWLARQGRQDEKTRVYGFTRSWSKMGSAASVVVAAALVYAIQDYRWVFLVCIGPCVGNIVNFCTYPAYLDGSTGARGSLGGVLRTLWRSIRDCVRSGPLRRLIGEAMGFQGVYKVTKDYVQPILCAAAVAMPVLLDQSDRRRTALLVGLVYLVLYLLSSLAARKAHAFVRWAGSPQRGAKRLWLLNLAAFAVMAGGILSGRVVAVVAAFVALEMLQNFWRPILVSRFSDHAASDQMATMLSVESQAKSLMGAVLAPLIGLAVDLVPSDHRFLPIAACGLVVAGMALVTSPRRA